MTQAALEGIGHLAGGARESRTGSPGLGQLGLEFGFSPRFWEPWNGRPVGLCGEGSKPSLGSQKVLQLSRVQVGTAFVGSGCWLWQTHVGACGQRAGGTLGAPESVGSGWRSGILLRERFPFCVPPTGTRNAVLNTEARTIDADVLSRRCVLMRLLDFSYEQYQKALRQSAGAVVIILPRAMAAVPQDIIRVSPCPHLLPRPGSRTFCEKRKAWVWSQLCDKSFYVPEPLPFRKQWPLFPFITGSYPPQVTLQGDVWGHLSLSQLEVLLARDAAQHPTVSGTGPTESDPALVSAVPRGRDLLWMNRV